MTLALCVVALGLSVHVFARVIHDRTVWIANIAFLLIAELMLLTATPAAILGLSLTLFAISIYLRRARSLNAHALGVMAALAMLATLLHPPAFVVLVATFVMLALSRGCADQPLNSHLYRLAVLLPAGLCYLIRNRTLESSFASISSGNFYADGIAFGCLFVGGFAALAGTVELRVFRVLLRVAAVLFALGLLGGSAALTSYAPPIGILVLLAFKFEMDSALSNCALFMFMCGLAVRWLAILL